MHGSVLNMPALPEVQYQTVPWWNNLQEVRILQKSKLMPGSIILGGIKRLSNWSHTIGSPTEEQRATSMLLSSSVSYKTELSLKNSQRPQHSSKFLFCTVGDWAIRPWSWQFCTLANKFIFEAFQLQISLYETHFYYRADQFYHC